MVRRFYVHNFRCLKNFELSLDGRSSILLIGKNGSGKTTLARALRVLQKIARGTNRVGDVLKSDLFNELNGEPLRLTLEVQLSGALYIYTVAAEMPKGFREPRVLDESLHRDGVTIYDRQYSEVHLSRQDRGVQFQIDWHLIALPIIQDNQDRTSTFKQWLARTLILQPAPWMIRGESSEETLEPDFYLATFAAWLSGVIAQTPAAYSTIDAYLRQLMPDLKDLRNPLVGSDTRSWEVTFSNGSASLKLPLEKLSDGEKCFLVCATVLAANRSYGPLLCFWDELENHISLSEVGHFVSALRRAFYADGGQLIATSHNPEVIGAFSKENTFVLQRNSHLEPATIRSVESMDLHDDLVNASILGEL